ncbi:A24 family peptidase [Vampirovibrio sp.]|uniref:prepilin peptidase n=1 Tax=Vampirovibrio sp. TaxID=2717857 RepID=UPI003593B64B
MSDPTLQAFWMVFLFVIGLCVGSFLNVMALRFLADEPIVLPPSHCPQCNSPLRAIDNIPVISYLLLGGQCHYCKTPISIQYPLVELATAMLFCGTVWFFGLTWQSAFLLFMISNLIVIFITDLRESLIFNFNSIYMLIPAGLLYSVLNLGNTAGTAFTLDLGALVLHVPEALISALMAMLISVVFFEGMILFSRLCFGTDGFGHGDTFLMMGAGAFLGWPLTVLALLLGFVVQTIPAIPMLVIQWIKNKQYTSLISGAVALAGGGSPLILMNTPFSPESKTLISLICLVISVIALIVFLKQVRTAQTFTYLPLGPALVLGILVSLFFGQDIISLYQGYLLRN